MKRENGYYWVKYKGKNKIAEWHEDRWYFYLMEFFDDSNFSKVDERRIKNTNEPKNKIMEKHKIIKDYKCWKFRNPDEDYQYDEIHEFFTDFSRGELYSFMEWVLQITSDEPKI